jgi:hypothetical protein
MEVSPAKYKYNSFFQREYNPNNTKKISMDTNTSNLHLGRERNRE